jgi:hypothetical protein
MRERFTDGRKGTGVGSRVECLGCCRSPAPAGVELARRG